MTHLLAATTPPHCPLAHSPPQGAAVENSLSGFFQHLFDTSSYPARWNCGQWTSLEGWLHIASDVGIFLAYFAIPVALIYFTRKRKDIPLNGIVFLFAAFILCCGAGHLLEAVIFYYPVYRVAGLLKLTTAIVSWVTVLALLKVSPRILELPGLASRNELLKQADLAKSAFLANMSHEIRTPMSAILGYADVLLEENAQASPESKEAMLAIQRNGHHLLEIINDILDLSKIEAGKLDIEQQACSPGAVVADVVELLRGRASAKGLTLDARSVGPLPETIRTDAMRLRQILINVVGNAIKFTDSGTVRIVMRLDRRNSGDSKLQFDVIDTGIGLSPEGIERLFKPFTQVDSSVMRKHGGTGLGLAISRKLALALDGDITVSAVPGGGSTFSITVATGPLAKESMTAPAPPVLPTASSAAVSAPQLGCRILLAEDGADNQRLIKYLLQKAGAEVTITPNGEEAIREIFAAQAAGEPFDAVLMDMQMPVLDGYQATRTLRDLGYRGPIIAVTAHAMSGDREKCLAAGCNEYLSKPLDRHALVETIARFLEQRTGPASPVAAQPVTTK
jgi:signal transduction histidine kinase/CheY-like chemotaxis protein